jgi:TolB-like protein
MRKVLILILCLLMMHLYPGSTGAEETKKIAVLPFTIHSAENIDYIKSGVLDMLISRLSASEYMNVTDKNMVADALKKIQKKDFNAADVYGLGKQLGVDFVVWGSITKIGNSVSLDGKLLDIATYKSPVGIFEQCEGIDEVIPRINTFAKKINLHLLGQVPVAFTPPSEKTPPPQPAQPVAPSTPDSSAIEALKTPEGTYTAIINPNFISEAQPLDRKGFWITRRYSTEFKGMDIGDVNKDGLNEVVVIDDNNVMVYQKKGKTLKLLHKRSDKAYVKNLALDVADINGNGIKEIIVTSLTANNLASYVLEFQDGKFKMIASKLRWFLRVIDIAGEATLLGQMMGLNGPFEYPIYEIVWENGEYVEGERMDIPEGLSVYGLTIDSVDREGIERVIALDDYDHLRIYVKTQKPISKIHVFGGSDESIWKGDDVFGGSTTYIKPDEQGTATEHKVDAQSKTYINVRIITYDINNDGKREIIIVKNMSSSGRLFENIRSFTKSEIYNLQWDGMGISVNWKTRPIQGYVADYQFKDIDNDGENEIVLALVTTSGGITKPRSQLAAYDLKLQ